MHIIDAEASRCSFLTVLGLAYVMKSCSVDADLQMVVVAILPLCVAVSNLHTLQSGDTGLHVQLHRTMTICDRQFEHP